MRPTRALLRGRGLIVECGVGGLQFLELAAPRAPSWGCCDVRWYAVRSGMVVREKGFPQDDERAATFAMGQAEFSVRNLFQPNQCDETRDCICGGHVSGEAKHLESDI